MLDSIPVSLHFCTSLLLICENVSMGSRRCDFAISGVWSQSGAKIDPHSACLRTRMRPIGRDETYLSRETSST